MLAVNLIVVGKLKEAYLRDACAEYAKRLSAFCRLTIWEENEARVPENASDAQIEAALLQEGKRILSRIPEHSFVTALCIEGKELSSVDFSHELEQRMVEGVSQITFVIGGSWGLSPEVKQRADRKLSFSPMTFPHQLARVMLLEQIYRAFQISGRGKYHK